MSACLAPRQLGLSGGGLVAHISSLCTRALGTALGSAGFSLRSASSVTLARVRRKNMTNTKVHAPCFRGDCVGRMDDRIVRTVACERNTGTQETRGGEIEMYLHSYWS